MTHQYMYVDIYSINKDRCIVGNYWKHCTSLRSIYKNGTLCSLLNRPHEEGRTLLSSEGIISLPLANGLYCLTAVADPGFPRGGGANSPGGCQHTILPNFPKNCMKLKEFGPRGGGGRVQNFTM